VKGFQVLDAEIKPHDSKGDDFGEAQLPLGPRLPVQASMITRPMGYSMTVLMKSSAMQYNVIIVSSFIAPILLTGCFVVNPTYHRMGLFSIQNSKFGLYICIAICNIIVI
jgi:hypothetical protein